MIKLEKDTRQEIIDNFNKGLSREDIIYYAGTRNGIRFMSSLYIDNNCKLPLLLYCLLVKNNLLIYLIKLFMTKYGFINDPDQFISRIPITISKYTKKYFKKMHRDINFEYYLLSLVHTSYFKWGLLPIITNMDRIFEKVKSIYTQIKDVDDSELLDQDIVIT